MKKEKLKPIPGDRFGKLVYVGVHTRNHGKPAHKFLCDCGNEHVGRLYETVKRAVPQCRECYRESMIGMERPNLRVEGLTRTKNVAYYRFTQQAEKKGEEWLSREEWESITQMECYYCGWPPSNTFPAVQPWAEDYIYQGIDRIDSALGYTVKNSRPCCWRCNRMKGAVPELDFVEHLRKIVERHDARK